MEVTSAEDTGVDDVSAALGVGSAVAMGSDDKSAAEADKNGYADAYQTGTPSRTQKTRGWQGWWSHGQEKGEGEGTEEPSALYQRHGIKERPTAKNWSIDCCCCCC